MPPASSVSCQITAMRRLQDRIPSPFTQRLRRRFGNRSIGSFESAFKDAGGWAVLIQNPIQLPAQVDQQRWLTAASDLAPAGQEQAAANANKARGAQ